MKKTLVAMALVLVAGMCIYAATVSTIVRSAGTASSGLNIANLIDSTEAHDKKETDTFYSDTVDVSDYSRVGLFYNLGTVAKCDSCNDSIIIRVTAFGYNDNAYQSYKLDTAYFGGNNITTIDDSTVIHFVNLDTMPVQKIFFRTIVFDSLLKQWTWPQDSIVNATAITKYTTTIPLHINVTGR